MYFQSEWKAVWILIRWLHQKPADLDLQYLKEKEKSGFIRTRVSFIKIFLSSKSYHMTFIRNKTIIRLLVHLFVMLQSVTCLTWDPAVGSLIPARSHTFAEIDCEIISTVILPPSAHSRRVVVSYKRKYVHKVLVNCLVKLALQKKCG